MESAGRFRKLYWPDRKSFIRFDSRVARGEGRRRITCRKLRNRSEGILRFPEPAGSGRSAAWLLWTLLAIGATGSVRVKVGDKVTRGQVLGLVGNSGNASEPHLHFHICNLNSEIGCEGLPYALSWFELQGKSDNWKASEPHPAPVKREMEIPTEDEIVSFLEIAK
jgi:Peptidase family M23